MNLSTVGDSSVVKEEDDVSTRMISTDPQEVWVSLLEGLQILGVLGFPWYTGKRRQSKGGWGADVKEINRWGFDGPADRRRVKRSKGRCCESWGGKAAVKRGAEDPLLLDAGLKEVRAATLVNRREGAEVKGSSRCLCWAFPLSFNSQCFQNSFFFNPFADLDSFWKPTFETLKSFWKRGSPFWEGGRLLFFSRYLKLRWKWGLGGRVSRWLYFGAET